MAQFCISFPPPSYQELFDQIKHLKPDFSKLKNLIPLIGLPIPIYIDISQYSNEISQMIQYWQSRLSAKTLMAMIRPMASLLGQSLADLLPKIPFLNISIVDLMAMDANVLKQKVKDALGIPFKVFDEDSPVFNETVCRTTSFLYSFKNM